MPMSPDYGTTRSADCTPARTPLSGFPVHHGQKGLNLINKKLFHGRPHRCVLAITSSCI